MTQEQKDILLKDLCARLPYGVKVVIRDTFKYSIVARENHVLDISNFSDIFGFNYKKFDKRMKKAMRERPTDIVIKPYLFPLSSMTEEQKEKALSLLRNCDYYLIDGIIKWLDNCPIEFFDWCNKHHFDYRGLIEKGLAIDATELNIY